MAGASTKDIKARIKSVSSTMQITKAMELVATSKLRRAKERLERSRPFYETLGHAIDEIQASSDVQRSIWSAPAKGERTLYIVIAGDRGLAGGYNSNIFRLAASESQNSESDIFLPIGKKALEFYKNRNAKIYSTAFEYVDDVSVGDALSVARKIADSFKAGEFDRCVIVYTKFDSMLTQTPKMKVLLPIEREKSDVKMFDPIFGGEPEEMLDKIVPDYIGGIVYSTVCESLASELGARRTAMDAANKNASEIIDSLMLEFNRARQALITQEITEIVSGSEAL